MGYSDQKLYDRPQIISADSAFLTGTFTASGTNTLANVFYPPQYMRAKNINAWKSECQVAPAANTTAMYLYYKNGTNTFGTVTLCGTAVATAGQSGGYTLSAPTVSTNTFTNTLPNGSTVVTSNTTTTSYNQFAVGTGPTVTLVGVGTASGQTLGTFWVATEEQELYS